jgi:hypothetical protein
VVKTWFLNEGDIWNSKNWNENMPAVSPRRGLIRESVIGLR